MTHPARFFKGFFAAAAAMIMGALLFTYQHTAHAALQVGQPAPDFTLPGSDGATHSLSQHKGKVVVLEWFNKDCPFVRKHYDEGAMQKLQQQYTAQDVVWLSVVSSAEGKQGHLATAEAAVTVKQEEKANPTAMLLDHTGDTGRLYGAKTTPHMYIIDETGVLRYQGAIDSIASAKSSDIADATNYVQQALDEHAAGKPISVAVTKPYGCSVKY